MKRIQTSDSESCLKGVSKDANKHQNKSVNSIAMYFYIPTSLGCVNWTIVRMILIDDLYIKQVRANEITKMGTLNGRQLTVDFEAMVTLVVHVNVLCC